MPAIETTHLSKSYHHYQVLRDVSLAVEPGECYALFGPNGAGKTTLLKILATLQRPSGGSFRILGCDGVQDRNAARANILLLAHGSYLYQELSAVENLHFALGLRGISATDRELKIALDTAGIGAFAEFKTRFFSEGMKKRLAIAKAILVRPAVLLLDEPYSSLDERGMAVMNGFIRESTQHGATVFMTSHNRRLTSEVAAKVGFLQHGVLRSLSVKELIERDELF